MKLSIIIPAYNEENRIERTIRAYYDFFSHNQKQTDLAFELVIVINGSKDNTFGVVEQVKTSINQTNIIIINMLQAGKGLAIKTGFADALKRTNDLIGFVDADMATSPEAFYDLVQKFTASTSDNVDGIIASRYMPGAQIAPVRPAYKRYGSRLIYEPYVWLLFGLSYYDYQCGAKLFTRKVIQKITPHLSVTQWAFDVELLYLCKKNCFIIKEVPTVWNDQAGSTLTLRGGLKMFSALFQVWKYHLKKF